MDKATIHFADGSSIELKENDFLTPIVMHSDNDKTFAAKDEPIDLYVHINDGLIPSIMDALCKCNFFYVNSDTSVAYSSHSIIKVELN